MRPSWSVYVSMLFVCVGALVVPQAGLSAGCQFSKSDCARLEGVYDLTIRILDHIDDEDAEVAVLERRADRLTQEGSLIAARAAWRDVVRARVAARDVLMGFLVNVAPGTAILRIGPQPSPYDDPAAGRLVNAQLHALASYMGQLRDLWDLRIVQALARVRVPQPPAVNGAKVKAVAAAGAAASASGAAVKAAVGPGRHPWPPVTDDAGLRDLWAQYGAETVALSAGFDRLVRGLKGNQSAAERKTRADGMAVLLGEYRATWKVMLTRLNTAKGLTAYAGCRSKLIEHAKGLRVRDGLIVRLIRAVRKGDDVGMRRALAAQRAQGAKDRQLAARVRACLKAAGPPGAKPGPVNVPARLDLSSLCPKSIVRLGVTLVQVAAAQTDYVFHCDYALPTNNAIKPVRVDILWWSPTSGSSGGVGNCTEGIDRYSTGGKWYSGSHYLSVQSLAGFDDRQAILKKTLDDAEKRNFALRCDYKA